ncbi:hypothetical protein KM043_001726 [Ampulex compressa]|nr:hypothetical protein KM043_001726 [Ampulex compressa]
MACLRTLPLLHGAKIVIDEGLDAMYGKTLIAGWMRMWHDQKIRKKCEILTYSDPQFWCQEEFKQFELDIKIHDCCTLNLDTSLQMNEIDNLKQIIKIINLDSIVIIDCLTSMIMYAGQATALWFMQRLNTKVSQSICIYRRDFVKSKVPCIETLGSTYIKLDKFCGTRTSNNFKYVAKILRHKLGISSLCHFEAVNQDIVSYDISSEKIMAQKHEKSDSITDNQKQKIESSFRIEISEHEMKQRENTPLPYALNATTASTSKILYQPDDVDDIDEEDPDDDLCV